MVSKPLIRVLSVDARLRDLQRISETLSSAHPGVFAFDRVCGVEEVVSSAAFDDPDVILLDLTRPDSKGLASVIRLTKAFPNTPVIVMTSHRDRSLAESAVPLGAWGYITGSNDDHRLLEVFRAALSPSTASSNHEG